MWSKGKRKEKTDGMLQNNDLLLTIDKRQKIWKYRQKQ